MIPFGVSVGDSISGLQCLYSVLEAADASTGSRAQYSSVLAAIKSFREALQHLATLQLTPAQQKDVTSILERYESTITSFAAQIQIYEKAFMDPASRDWWRKLPKKIHLQRTTVERVKWFSAELAQHSQALSLILLQVLTYISTDDLYKMWLI